MRNVLIFSLMLSALAGFANTGNPPAAKEPAAAEHKEKAPEHKDAGKHKKEEAKKPAKK